MSLIEIEVLRYKIMSLIIHSCVHTRWNEVFFLDSEETIHSAEINDSLYEPPICFSLGKK